MATIHHCPKQLCKTLRNVTLNKVNNYKKVWSLMWRRCLFTISLHILSIFWLKNKICTFVECEMFIIFLISLILSQIIQIHLSLSVFGRLQVVSVHNLKNPKSYLSISLFILPGQYIVNSPLRLPINYIVPIPGEPLGELGID